MSTTVATSVTKVRIRPATPFDSDAVFSLVEQLADSYDVDREAFDEAFRNAVGQGDDHLLLVAEGPAVNDLAGIDAAGIDAAADGAADGAATALASTTGTGGPLFGYVLMTIARLMYTRGDTAQIQELIVDSGARNDGIGSRLVYAVEDICRERGISQLTVASSRAAAFYDRLDYRSTADFLKKKFAIED